MAGGRRSISVTSARPARPHARTNACADADDRVVLLPGVSAGSPCPRLNNLVCDCVLLFLIQGRAGARSTLLLCRLSVLSEAHAECPLCKSLLPILRIIGCTDPPPNVVKGI